MRNAIMFMVTLLAACICQAQVSFVFMPEVYGRSVDGLGVFQIQNLTGTPLKGSVAITVKENLSKTTVARIQTPVFNIGSGNNNISRAIFMNSAFHFYNNKLAALVNQTRNFPPGEYTFCYRFMVADKTQPEEYEDCFEASVQPIVPLSLIYPADRDKICEKRPPLSWQSPIPYSAGMRFRLLLTEKKLENSLESLLASNPLVVLDNISASMINYPPSSPDLKEGHTYCWQVVAYERGLITSKSEIWEFTVECKEPSKQIPNDSYRELKQLVNGNYYIANRALKFSFQNNYTVNRLNYVIEDISNGLKKIRNLPEVTVSRGLNKIDIDLTELDLISGKQYLLKIYPFNEPIIELRFVYEDKDEK